MQQASDDDSGSDDEWANATFAEITETKVKKRHKKAFEDLDSDSDSDSESDEESDTEKEQQPTPRVRLSNGSERSMNIDASNKER